MGKHEMKIASLENLLSKEKKLLKICQTRIQIAIEKFYIKIIEKIEHIKAISDLINDKSTEKSPNYHAENEHLTKDKEAISQEIRRIDSQIMVYKRAYLSLNEACELQVDSDKLELSNPLYSDAFIHFISAGAAFCTKIKMGKSVNYPDLKANKGYNFFEELIEKIAASENANKIVRKMEFSLNKKEQKKDYDAIMGPRGALRKSGILMRAGKIGIDGIIEILGEKKVQKNGFFTKKKFSEYLYKVSKRNKCCF
ncbi:hypothetical protein niasHT_032183 [Heterodera trifolii]|uniref:Uncharacterized protein n=1 Tax=Heterodera trifolii TaxID=157864 RepID=A0ABD2HVE7_9BILA